MNKISIIIAGLISLFGYSVAQTSADNKYESLILSYLENEDNDEVCFKSIFKSESFTFIFNELRIVT